jgi:hypothetical protein
VEELSASQLLVFQYHRKYAVSDPDLRELLDDN